MADSWPAESPEVATVYKWDFTVVHNSSIMYSNPNDVLKFHIFPKYTFHRDLIKITHIYWCIEATQLVGL